VAVIGVGDVALMDRGPPGTVEVPLELLDELSCTFGVSAVPGRDRGALAGQAPADRGADTPGAAGDQCDPPGELVALVTPVAGSTMVELMSFMRCLSERRSTLF